MRPPLRVEPEVEPGDVTAAEQTIGAERVGADLLNRGQRQARGHVITDALLPIPLRFDIVYE